MQSKPSSLSISAYLLTSGRVIREVLTEATKPVKPSKSLISGRMSFKKHNVPVFNNVESIAGLKKKMEDAFEEFFVSGSQSTRHAQNTKMKCRLPHS
jgi:hypothetical protein